MYFIIRTYSNPLKEICSYSFLLQRVPHAFCVRYGDRIPKIVKLTVRTGYAIWLDFDKVKEFFVGMRLFFENFSITRGQTLVFEHCGGFEIKVCICDLYGSEIQYPNIVHNFQSCRPCHGMYYTEA